MIKSDILGLRAIEVPVDFKERVAGESKVGRRIVFHVYRSMRNMVRYRVRGRTGGVETAGWGEAGIAVRHRATR